jgi:hypothetical protein
LTTHRIVALSGRELKALEIVGPVGETSAAALPILPARGSGYALELVIA